MGTITAAVTLALLLVQSPPPLAREDPVLREQRRTPEAAQTFRAAVARDLTRLAAFETPAATTVWTREERRKNWIQRHPALFGAGVGFVTGFLIGFLPGDDAVFDDFVAWFNGLVLGGIGAGAGAIIGHLAGSR